MATVIIIIGTRNFSKQKLLTNTSEVITLPIKLKKKLNSVVFSSQANYTDRATAAC
jgi:hypothetical protein